MYNFIKAKKNMNHINFILIVSLIIMTLMNLNTIKFS